MTVAFIQNQNSSFSYLLEVSIRATEGQPCPHLNSSESIPV